MSRAGRHAAIAILFSLAVSGAYGGAAMIQAAEGAQGWDGWNYLGAASLLMAALALLVCVVLMRFKNEGKSEGVAPAMFEIDKLGTGDLNRNRPLGTLLRSKSVGTLRGNDNKSADS